MAFCRGICRSNQPALVLPPVVFVRIAEEPPVLTCVL